MKLMNTARILAKIQIIPMSIKSQTMMYRLEILKRLLNRCPKFLRRLLGGPKGHLIICLSRERRRRYRLRIFRMWIM